MPARSNLGLFCCCVAILFGLPSLGAEPPKKAAVPDAAAQADATKLIKEVFGPEITAAKTPAQKQALAKKLLQKAKESENDRSSQYCLLDLSREIALQGTDGPTAFQALEEMDKSFQVTDLFLMGTQAAILNKLAPEAKTAEQHKALMEKAVDLSNKAVLRDNYAAAKHFSDFALGEAKKCSDNALVKRATERNAEIDELSKTYESVKTALATLETSLTDPEANLTVGKYECFVKGEWTSGVKHLAIGNDAELKSLAETELKGVASSDEQAKLGDGWWKFAEARKGTAKKQIQRRAAHWYQNALPSLSGLVKDKIEKRLKELDDDPEASIVVRYDWSDRQLEDWSWDGEVKPVVKNGWLEFHSGGNLSLKRTDIRITDVALEVEALDRTQAMTVLVGENSYRLHFYDDFIQSGQGTDNLRDVPKVPAKMAGGKRSPRIAIPSTGNTILTVGDAKATSPVKKSGALSIHIDQPKPLLLGPVVVKGIKVN